MISAFVQEEIARLHFGEQKSVRLIAQELRIHRETVRRYIDSIEKGIQVQGRDPTTLVEQAVHYVRQKNMPRDFTDQKLTDELIAFVFESWMASKKKSRMAVFQEIRNHYHIVSRDGQQVEVDCNIGYSTFCKAIKAGEARWQRASLTNEQAEGDDVSDLSDPDEMCRIEVGPDQPAQDENILRGILADAHATGVHRLSAVRIDCHAGYERQLADGIQSAFPGQVLAWIAGKRVVIVYGLKDENNDAVQRIEEDIVALSKKS